MLTSSPESARTNTKKSPFFLTTTALVVGILSMNPRASADENRGITITPEMLDEIFPEVSLGDIPDESKQEIHDLIVGNDTISIQDIREHLSSKLTIGQRMRKDIHTKIMSDPDFRSLYDIREYALAELRGEGIIPTGIEVQIVPFHKSENGEYEYLRIVVTTREGKQNIALLTSEEEKVADILDTMLTNFESHIQKVALTVFKQEIESREYFHKIKIQKVINAVLQDEFRTYLHECYEYLETTIIQNTNGTADIYVTFRNRVNNETASLLVETDIAIPSPSQTYEPPMMAQNTPEIVE